MLLLAALSCGDDGEMRLSWRLVLGPDERPGTTYLVSVERGTCAAPGETVAAFRVARGDTPRELRLDPGPAAIHVVATDSACVEYAEGCADLSLPHAATEEAVVRLAARTEQPRCAPASCLSGRCLSGDGGALDAGPEACVLQPFYPDRDGDGAGDAALEVLACTPPLDHVATPGDCDDDDPDVAPTAPERCTNRDEDCDGAIDEATACAPCRELVRGDDRYLLCPDAIAWDEAVTACADRGRRLAKLDQEEEDVAVREAMRLVLEIDEFWIGLEDKDGDDTWFWLDGTEQTDYLPWTGGDPDNTPPRCVRSVSSIEPVGWRDRPCADPFPYVCDVASVADDS
ncbi:MAG: hypothetical protein CMN31_10095 [Sandaracinus sp.]|nr:hypothetical protein [Myxococcales bacterium]MAT25725.1 hypothetical protein [Sandaracinus sp.]MBJ71674.1 hypothetical protein [Sandaracinus sp.]